MFIFLAILFLYGATGMERRRGLSFSMITAGLFVLLGAPLLIQSEGSVGTPYTVVQLAEFVIGIIVLAIGSFFVGRLARLIVTTVAARLG